MIAILDQPAALPALAAEWEALWRRVGAPPFLSPAWLLPWWDVFGTPSLRVAVCREDGRLRGLLPMYGLQEERRRVLLPLGVGLSDYFDALAETPHVAAALLAALLDRACAEDIAACVLAELPPDAALRAAPPPEGWSETVAATPCPVLTLATGLTDLPAGMRRDVRQSRLRAGRDGGWLVDLATEADAACLWAELQRLHAGRWQARDGSAGVLADDSVQHFHRLAVPLLMRSGILRLWALRRGGRVRAAVHSLAAPGRLLLYLGGIDATDAFVSPGILLMAAIIEHAAATGVRELHFLRGAERYKFAWGAVDRPNATRTLHRPGHAG